MAFPGRHVFLTLLLSPLEAVYRVALLARRHYFRTFRTPQELGRPTIKVGNITVGGTGKTPFVIYLAKLLQRRSLQPVVLTRGFGRRSSGVLKVGNTGGAQLPVALAGDEPRLISDQVHCPVYVCEDRQAGAMAALREYPHATFILDDAYQQLAIYSDVTLLLIDATNPFDNGHLLPAGRLREPLHQIARADAIVVTRADHPFEQDWLIETLKKYNRAAPFFFSYHEVVGLQEVPDGSWLDTAEFRGRPVTAMSGIANPAVFRFDLAHQQIVVRHQLFFPDHHIYSQQDIDRALREADNYGSDLIVTTEKDAVKMTKLRIPSQKIYALGIEARVEEEEQFLQYLKMSVDL
ncbi:MAG: tetraacyldisaccharide 4'-kinase [Acidobacteria bacterium]|nr:tetraacyldisaccharide 4'-kinase [Acidobacteriota bacterium]